MQAKMKAEATMMLPRAKEGPAAGSPQPLGEAWSSSSLLPSEGTSPADILSSRAVRERLSAV